MLKKILKSIFAVPLKTYQEHKQRIIIRRNQKLKPEDYPAQIMKDWVKYTKENPFDLLKPVTYRQKIQWSKLYDENQELKTLLSDKFLVRDYIAKKIGSEYLIPIYGVYDNPNLIDFSILPKQFVIKTTHASGQVIIVKDKDKINKKKIVRQLFNWLSINYGFNIGLELHYSTIKPRIIIEQYMEDSHKELNDYKFLCFNGQPLYCWVDFDRFSSAHCRNVYDKNWVLQPWTQKLPQKKISLQKPSLFEKMLKIAEILSQGFGHVRVDLYLVDNKIYFGELTFTNGNGYEKIIPEEYDYVLGKLWKI